MEIVTCPTCDNDKPCYLKTGATEGSIQFGKSFYMCNVKGCNFKISTGMDPTMCMKHEGEICELQKIKSEASIDRKGHYYRCMKGRNDGLDWCGRKNLETSKNKENPSNIEEGMGESAKNKVSALSSSTNKIADNVDKTKGKVVVQAVVKPTENEHNLLKELGQKKKLVSQVDINYLPDKGKKLQDSIIDLEARLKKLQMEGGSTQNDLEEELPVVASASCKSETGSEASLQSVLAPAKLVVNQPGIIPPSKFAVPQQDIAKSSEMKIKYLKDIPNTSNPTYHDAGQHNYKQFYGGRMTNRRELEVRGATEAALVSLHKSLETCPAPQDEEPDPDGLRTTLKPHQRKALKWLLWREDQSPSGGILADDMGLGKTLTMLALILKDVERDLESEYNHGDGLIRAKTTLVVCPASLIHQWESEVIHHCKRTAFPGDVLLYHGTNREDDSKRLASYHIVVTSYNIIQKELKGSEKTSKDIWGQSANKEDDVARSCKSPLMKIIWNRIILDEGHNIKNPKTSTGIAICRLRAKSRWVVTGTPIHNNLMDLYGLLRFLRYSPFDEYQVWKNWMASTSSNERLSKLVKSIILKRNKNDVDENGKLIVELPKKTFEVHMLNLEGKQKEVYDKILSYSKSAWTRMLKETAQNEIAKEISSTVTAKKTVNAAQLLSLMTRMQQCCCHLRLLRPLLDGSKDPEEDDSLDDILQQMSNLNLNDEAKSPAKLSDTSINLSSYKRDKDFRAEATSIKLSHVLNEIKNVISSKQGDKCVVVSQWTTLLEIMGVHLKKEGISSDVIQGNVKLEERDRIMKKFNFKPNAPQVVLLSLKAGGVGLNLTGGNHLFLLDTHWNPALESQACDRVYRIGQTKDVKIHKFICRDTIEEHIMKLQNEKLGLASRVLEGNSDKNSHKISLQDLKAIFGFQ